MLRKSTKSKATFINIIFDYLQALLQDYDDQVERETSLEKMGVTSNGTSNSIESLNDAEAPFRHRSGTGSVERPDVTQVEVR